MRTSTILVGLMLLFVGDVTAAGDLHSQIKDWKSGDEVPHALLSFPDGKVPPLSLVRSDAYEDSFTARPYILSIKNDELLEAIIFDPRSERGAFEAAVVTLVDHKGLVWFAKLIANRSSTNWKLDAFREILNRSFSQCSVAFIAKDAMPDSEAKKALGEIRTQLDKGESWKDAYGSVADKHPDIKHRENKHHVPGTLVGYMYSGWASADGFDFSSLHFTANVPTAFFADAIRSGKGGEVVSAPNGFYLIYVFELYLPDR
jgi:hypothetical protein